MTESQAVQSFVRKSAPVVGWRIRFVRDAPAGASIIRSFADPVVAHAIVESADPNEVVLATNAADEIRVIQITVPIAPAAKSIRDAWMSASDRPTTVVALEDGRLHWRSGMTLLECGSENVEQILTAIAEFAFHEAHLRKLEEQLRPFELAAPSHVKIAYQIQDQDRAKWPQLAESAGQLAQLRLMAARLEPRSYCPPRDLPPSSRRLVMRLAARSDMEDRLEALSARLEACEDLYEGAMDRISEHKWGRKGSRLEIAIILLLAIEVILLLGDFAYHAIHLSPR